MNCPRGTLNCFLSSAGNAVLDLATVAIIASFTTETVVGAPAGWNMVWSDEFTGTTLDISKWDASFWNTPFNNEQQAYRPDHVTVSGGNLVLTADDSNNGGKDYTSGKVESKIANQYGRWEVRAKLPGTKGTWPAIWLLPDTNIYPWPTQGEVDIMENRGNQPNLTSSAFHYGEQWPNNQFQFDEQMTSHSGQLENYHDEFHTYAVEWDSAKIRFFVDEVSYFTLYDQDVDGTISNQAPMEVNLNVAVGGDFLGGEQPDGSSVWPQQMLVDYVRVYERNAMPPPAVFMNGSFEDQGGSLAGWGTFGNDISNVQTHDEAALDGNSALKLEGEDQVGTTTYSGVEQGISVSPGDNLSASANTLIRALNDLVGDNTVEMKFDFYSEFGAKYGSSDYISSTGIQIADANTANDVWLPHNLNAVAPAGAVEARLAFVFIQPGVDAGSVHIEDVSFTNLDLEFDADANANGDVEGSDFLLWQRGFGKDDGTSVSQGDFNYDGSVNAGDLDVWEAQYGVSAPFTYSSASVPEPSSVALVFFCCVCCVATCRGC